MQRRNFLKAAAVGGGLTILRGGLLSGKTAPSNRLNIALVGVWGRGTAHYNVMLNENVVALCDVNDLRNKEALEIFPKAKVYGDWRRMLDQKDIEAVIICSADHHHAFIANWAMNRGMHVYCEKPMGITVEEVRTLRANYLKNRGKLVTQHGTQRHAYPNFERLRELILDGAVGELKTVHGWDSRQLPRPGYPQAEGVVPAGLHYEQWIGPSPYHPYSPQYFGGASGMNCIFWNMYRDFGVGQMGDMGAHTMDLLWNSIDAGAPTSIEVDQEVSDKFNPNITPVKLKVSFEHPANQWRGPVTVVWYQGGLKPNPPKNYMDMQKIPNGVLFEGTKGSILADFTARTIIPNNDDGDLTYYKRRSKNEVLPLVEGTGQITQASSRNGGSKTARHAPPALPAGFTAWPNPEPQANGFPVIQVMANGLPAAVGMPNTDVQQILEGEHAGHQPDTGGSLFQMEWIDACKGKNNSQTHGTSSKTHCDFDYSGSMMEQMLLGLVAHQAGKRLEYDPATGRVTNDVAANGLLKRSYRSGWTLNG